MSYKKKSELLCVVQGVLMRKTLTPGQEAWALVALLLIALAFYLWTPPDFALVVHVLIFAGIADGCLQPQKKSRR